MAGANVRRWGPVSPEPRPTREGQVSTLGCSPLEDPRQAARCYSLLCTRRNNPFGDRPGGPTVPSVATPFWRGRVGSIHQDNVAATRRDF
jgi:hypothetical protein